MHKILRNLMLLLIIFIVCFSFYSCSNEYSALGGNCLECLSEQPDSANLVVYVTINAENPKVPLIIYRGVFDPNNLPNIEVIDTAISSTYTYYVPLYHNFSVKAEYKSGTKTIYAVDGSIFTSQQQDGCTNTCWQLIGGSLDARLKSY